MVFPQKNTVSLLRQSILVITGMLLYVLFWIFSIPIVSLILRKVPISLRLVIQSFCLLIFLHFFGFLNFWILLIPVSSVELGFYISKRKRLRDSTAEQLVLLAAVILLHLIAYLLFEVLLIESLELQLTGWFQRIDQYWESMYLRLGPDEVGRQFLAEGWFRFLSYVPSIYLGGFILGFYSSFLGTSVLSKFRCPEILFWLVTLSFALGFIDWGFAFNALKLEELFLILKDYQILFKNSFIICACLYFFQGLSVSSHLMEKFKIARFWQNLWYILIIFNLPMILVFIGLLDFIFEFRSFKEKK